MPAPSPAPVAALSIADFGAVCNGSFDNSSAIAKTIAAAKSQGVAVQIPAGVCAYGDVIRLDAVKLVGTGDSSVLYALDYNMSIGVWVGLVALLGVDAETGVFMLLFLDLAYDRAVNEGRMNSLQDLRAAIIGGSVMRIRPKVMTVITMFSLIPIMWSTGTGADVMKRIAAPMIGGIITSFVLSSLVYPIIYEVWKWHSEVKKRLAA